MNTNFKRLNAIILLLTILLSGCIDSELESGADQAQFDSAFFDDGGAAVQIVNARDNDVWIYFDLETFSIVSPADPLSDPVWDVAFQRFKVKTNGGVSGSAGVAVATLKAADFLTAVAPPDGYISDRGLSELSDEELLLLGDNIFFSVCAPGFDDEEKDNYCLADGQVDHENLNPNESAYVFLTQGSGVVKEGVGEAATNGGSILGWYDYYLQENHILRPVDDVWIFRSSQGIEFSFEMLGYYGYQEGDAESGTISFRYLSLDPDFQIPPPGDQPLSVEVTADNLSGVAPLTVTFQGSADGIVGTAIWTWDFGDSATSAEQNPQHIYTDLGTYTAMLTVSDDRGISSTNSVIITVAETGGLPPTANAGTNQNITLNPGETGISVTLDGSLSADTDGTIVSYIWTGKPTGAPDPDDVVQPVVQLDVGGYEFTLIVTDDSGNSAEEKVSIAISSFDNQLPVAVATLDVGSGAAPLNVAFTGDASSDSDGSVVNWHWDFGDGSTSDGVANTAHSFSPGVYDVVLTVTDDMGATNITSLTVRAGYVATQDTYVYELLGNQDDPAIPGDSGNISVWNHESGHGGKGLIQFDPAWVSDEALTGNYIATLHLYNVCEPSGFVGACPGPLYPDTDNPFTPDIATVKIDILLQEMAWLQDDAELAWADITETSTPFATLTLSNDSGWSSIDVTGLVNTWINGSADFGFSLSQEAYPVLRVDSGSIPVAAFCDSESSEGVCASGNFKPYLVIKRLP